MTGDGLSTAERLRSRLVRERRPLYLDPRRPAQVDLDGYSLVVAVENSAVQRLPLRQLSRIVASARCQFSTAALLACADRGLPVLIVDATGNVRCRLLGQAGDRQALVQRLVDFLGVPDWRDRYATWLDAHHRRGALRVRRSLGLPPEAGGVEGTRFAIRRLSAHFAVDAADAAASERLLDESLFAWMFSHLQGLGLDGRMELGHDGHPDLVSDLSGLHAWNAVVLRLGWLRRRRAAAERDGVALRRVERQDVVRLYQRHHAGLERRGIGLLSDLHRWLVEMD